VGHEPRADDQDPLVAQGPQAAADVEQARRVVGGHGQLQHRDVAVGVHDLQRDPGAVVEAAAGVLVDRLAVRHGRGHPGRQGAGVRGRVGHLEVAAVEAGEVVHQRSAGSAGGQAQRRRLPVGADDEDGGGRGKGLGPAEQLLDPGRVLEQGRRPVAQVQRGHRPVLGCPEPPLAGRRRGVAQEGVEGGAGCRWCPHPSSGSPAGSRRCWTPSWSATPTSTSSSTRSWRCCPSSPPGPWA
jgi:hypothetical protein